MKKSFKNIYLLIGFLFSGQIVVSQNFTAEELHIPIEMDSIYGTLLTPKSWNQKTLIIIIPGSGATDRNCNQGAIQSNATKYLAESLAEKGFSTYRYDKSVISQSKLPNFKEENYTFSELITEVKEIVSYFRKNKETTKIVLAGHSQGSLVGMLAAQDIADIFISLNGPGRPIDKILYEQLNRQLPNLESSFSKAIEQLKKGKKVTEVNPMLAAIFRPSVQPFLMDFMQYNPTEIISKLSIPILIIGGTKDIQIPENDAKLLAAANKNAKLVIIENMNHIFKEIKGSDLENQMSYLNPNLPILSQLVDEIVLFLNEL